MVGYSQSWRRSTLIALCLVLVLTAMPGRAARAVQFPRDFLHGIWTAEIKPSGPTNGSIQSLLTFKGDQYRLELRSTLTGRPRLIVVGYFAIEPEGSADNSLRVTFTPVRWQPTQTCQDGACRDVGPIQPSTALFTVKDHETIEDDAGESYSRKVALREPPPGLPENAVPALPAPGTPLTGIPTLPGAPAMPAPFSRRSAVTTYDERKKQCLGGFNSIDNAYICQIFPPTRGCDSVSGYGRDTQAYHDFCVCMGHPDGRCG